MCTAISINEGNHYFGRNLDYEYTFGEKICVTPRNFLFEFSNGKKIDSHFAVIGVAKVEENYPLYFDGMNEKGLCMAGLNFPIFCHYTKQEDGKENIASYELIPRILSECKNLTDAKSLCSNFNITDKQFKENMPPSPLHWIISDKTGSAVVEQTKDGLKIYDNPIGVLTNSPDFDKQMFNLNNYLMLSPKDPCNNFAEKINLETYSRGMGAAGLPGDNSSMSRFVRASFNLLNSVSDGECVSQLFRILYSVYQVRGSVRVGERCEITNYTSVCDCDRGIYYFTTYNNLNVCCVNMYDERLVGKELKVYDLYKK